MKPKDITRRVGAWIAALRYRPERHYMRGRRQA